MGTSSHLTQLPVCCAAQSDQTVKAAALASERKLGNALFAHQDTTSIALISPATPAQLQQLAPPHSQLAAVQPVRWAEAAWSAQPAAPPTISLEQPASPAIATWPTALPAPSTQVSAALAAIADGYSAQLASVLFARAYILIANFAAQVNARTVLQATIRLTTNSASRRVWWVTASSVSPKIIQNVWLAVRGMYLVDRGVSCRPALLPWASMGWPAFAPSKATTSQQETHASPAQIPSAKYASRTTALPAWTAISCKTTPLV